MHVIVRNIGRRRACHAAWIHTQATRHIDCRGAVASGATVLVSSRSGAIAADED